MMKAILGFVAVVEGHLTSWYWKLTYAMHPPIKYYNGSERRKNPRRCVLCRGPMRPAKSQINDVLEWFQCGRCHKSQTGVPR